MHVDGSGVRAFAVSEEPRAMALDARSGEIWSLMAGGLLVIDAEGNTRLRLPLPEDARYSPTLEYDSEKAVAIIRTPSRSIRISRDGRTISEITPAKEEAFDKARAASHHAHARTGSPARRRGDLRADAYPWNCNLAHPAA